MAFPSPGGGQDLHRQRVVHFPGGHRQVKKQPVGFLADDAELAEVALQLVDQPGGAAQPQRLQPVSIGDGDSRSRRAVEFMRDVLLHRHRDPVHIGLDGFRHLAEQPRRLRHEPLARTAQVKVHRINVEPARLVRECLHRGLEPGGGGFLNRAKLVTTAIHSQREALQRQRDCFFPLVRRSLGGGGSRWQQSAEVLRRAREEERVRILHALGPCDAVNALHHAGELDFKSVRRLPAPLVVVQSEEDFRYAVFTDQAFMIRRPSILAVKADDTAEPRRPKAHRIESCFSDDQALRGLRRDPIEHASMRLPFKYKCRGCSSSSRRP